MSGGFGLLKENWTHFTLSQSVTEFRKQAIPFTDKSSGTWTMKELTNRKTAVE